jgi:hypothetical protein
MCERFVHFRENSSLDTIETVGPGSTRPNIRHVYKGTGPREDRRDVLVCREMDTNLDGIKDVVRTFNDKGEPLHEETDSNYDGKIDHWVTFADGRIAEEDSDETLSTGHPNVWKFYVAGALSRVRRNTHCPSGKPDTWEIFVNDRLERIGNDLTCDGHVDRWDRDAQLQARDEASSAGVSDGGSAMPTAALTDVPGDAGQADSAAPANLSSRHTDGGAPSGSAHQKTKSKR